MQITEVKFEAGWLMLRTPARECFRFLKTFRVGDWELKRISKRRSLNANAYAWQLITLISSEIGISREEVYKDALKNIGGKSCVITLKKEASEAFAATFCGDHIGRSVELIGEDGDTVDLLVNYGSSDFDGRQMSQLIDALTQDARSLGIETLEDARLNAIIEEWNERHG